MEFKEISLDRLVPSRNLRTEGIDEDALAELVASIREHGLLQPIRVRPLEAGHYQIIAGHRRFLAHRRLGEAQISAVVVDETDQSVAVQSIVENLQRESLTPAELARGISELASSFGMSLEDISTAVSKSVPQVRTHLRIARLPDEVLSRLESGDGRTQRVRGITTRHVQPFVSDLPWDAASRDDPEVIARIKEATANIIALDEEQESRGVHINAHMADAIARQTKSGAMTVGEAIDEVLTNPDKYKYGRTITSPEEAEEATWVSYKKVHQDMLALAYRLRPEIASAFSESQRRDLSDRLTTLSKALTSYAMALESTGAQAGLQQLTEGANQ